MAIRINKKSTAEKSTAKTAEKKPVAKKEKVVKEKKEKAVKEKKAKPFLERITFGADLVLEQKYTDEEIKDMVNAEFPEYTGSPAIFNQGEMGRIRWMLRNDKLTTRKLKDGQPFARLFRNPENGELVERSELPKVKRAIKKKVTEDNDPLKNIAGINVHEQEETAPKKKTKQKATTEDVLNKIKKTKKQ